MKLYLLKTGYACCPDGDWVVGLFTDLDKLREAICVTADKLWKRGCECEEQEDEILYSFENVFVEAWEPNCSSYLDDYDDRFCVTYVLRPSGPDDRTPLVSELFGEEIYH